MSSQSFEKLAFEVQQAQHQMTPEQRLRFWEVIQMNWCKYCGGEIKNCFLGCNKNEGN